MFGTITESLDLVCILMARWSQESSVPLVIMGSELLA